MLTATELTCIGTFHVSPFAIVAEGNEKSDTLDTATPVNPNVTVLGILGYEPIDLYRVPVRAGQPLSVEVDSVRIADIHYGGSEFDLAVRILDQHGRQLAANDDNSFHVQDPVVSVIPAYDGIAFVEVKRSVFVNTRTTYCVHIGTNRRPLVAFPPGGQAGSRHTFQFLGDVAGAFEETLMVPESCGCFGYFGDAPSPVTLRSSLYPNVLEEATAAETRVEQLPAALNGIIDRHDDTDAFRLTVTQGEPLQVRVFASTLNSPIDARIRIRRIGEEGVVEMPELEADDARLDERDIFGTSYRAVGGRKDVLDPSVIWTPKEDGDYLLEVSDSSGAGGPTGIYRIEIEPPRTIVQTVLQSRTNDWTESTSVSGLAIPRGNRWTVNVSLPQGQWTPVQGEFNLVARGLPTGVRLIVPRIKPGTTYWPVQLVAEPRAKPGGAVITFEAQPVDAAEKVEARSQQNVPFINHPGGDALHAVQLDRYVMGVTDPAPFSIDIERPTIPLVRGGELAIPVKITRRAGFDGPVEFYVGYVPRGIDSQPPTRISAGESEGIMRLSAGPSAPLGTMPFVVVGNTVHETLEPYLGTGHIRVSSEIVDLTVMQPYVELASQPESIRRGERKGFVWTVRHHNSFEGEARVNLLGLPKGVSVLEPLPTMTKDSPTVTFQLRATDEALLGQASGLICEVNVPIGKQQIVQRTGKGTLRVDPAKDIE